MSRPKRYLEEKKVIDTINYWWRTAIIADGQPTLCDEIRALPTEDVKPVVHGEWERETFDLGADLPIRVAYQCSECGNYFDSEFNFCPHCGSDMRGGENEAN